MLNNGHYNIKDRNCHDFHFYYNQFLPLMLEKKQQLINNQSINNHQNIVCPGQRNTKTQKKIINTTRSHVCICNHISSIILFCLYEMCIMLCVCVVYTCLLKLSATHFKLFLNHEIPLRIFWCLFRCVFFQVC